MGPARPMGDATMSATRPPVTEQDDWVTLLLPWLQDASTALEVAKVPLDVDRVHAMTGIVAHDVQRSMAPISAFLVGAAVARGMPLELACRVVEDITRARAERADGGTH